MLLAPYPRNICFNHGDKATSIEVPPLTMTMVMGRALKPTRWARESCQGFMRERYGDLRFLHLEIYFADLPWSF
ncbi:MAG: hypothetical protein SAMD01599839_06180 [Rectinema sp.]